jgi:serine/threonine protein kinase
MSKTARAFTPAYAPPELFDEDYAGPGKAGDVYSLAATLYALLSGAPPRDPGRPLPQYALMAHHIRTRDLPVPDVPGAPPVLMEILQSALHRDPARRPSAEALLDALRRL